MSIQFNRKRFTFTQPDGTALEVFGTGNQYEANFETLDGHTVVRDPATGFYELAVLDEEQEDLRPSGIAPEDAARVSISIPKGLRRAGPVARARSRATPGLPRGGARWEKRLAAKRAPAPAILGMAPPTRTTVGQFTGLVLLIEFPDVPGTIDWREVERFCNAQGYSGFQNNGSVRDYFLDVSGNALDYRNVVTPGYYKAQRNRAYYTNPSVAMPIRTYELIKEALRYWKQRGFDFTQLTVDGDECAYAVNTFYSGPCINNWSEGLWPHCHYLPTKFKLANGVYAHDYQITNMGSELSLGTFCHENGHMICDFPDLYDYGYESSGVGHYCLMCGGNNADEKNPTQVGAYLKYKAGWTAPGPLGAGPHSLRAGTTDALLFSKTAKEYYILENRSKAGRDAALPDEGLAIWRVDEDGDNQHEQGSATLHYECSLVQADGRRDLERLRGHDGGSGDFYGGTVKSFGSGTVPSSAWWDGGASGLEIDAISAPGPIVTFTVK